MISTVPFRMQPKEFLLVTVRDNYRRFWWFPLICLACAIVIWVDGGIVNIMIGAAFLLIGLLEPLLLSKWKVALTMRAPMSTKDFSVDFDDNELRIMSGDELLSRFKYDDLVRCVRQPEGIQLWYSHLHWTLVPRRAFASEADFVEALRLVGC
ncbi:MAG: hypothetical protein H0W86_13660 [Armatimonadetes bacterium]|nr:hypothetical protein [Armatimonadota bacterium]